MRVEVRLFATLADYLPPDSRGGAAAVDIAAGSTLDDLARALGIPADASWIALVNDEEAPPARRLAPDDVVTLFPPLAGGAPARAALARPPRSR
ncbi:MAG: MoaD/ThiS family protein [Candidatus Rokubacteria bacterium]|nr:MoaD/ThiS family protein [Candidatus Rokubacteria bacterium]